MFFEEIISSTPSLLALSSPEHEKDTLSILPTIHEEEEEHMTSGEIGLELGGKNLSLAEQALIPLTPPPEFNEEEYVDFWPSVFDVELGSLLSERDAEEDYYSYFLLGSFDLEHDGYFPTKFKKYMDRELKWSRLEISGEPRGYIDLGLGGIHGSKDIRWLFWSRQDDDRPPSDDNFMDLNPDDCASLKVRDNIRHALKEMILNTSFGISLVQFWAPIKTLDGRTLLTTQNQPFALGETHKESDRQHLCEYRMRMCGKNKFFCVDAESGEEQLGLLARVFLRKFPESAPDVQYYSKIEYPQLDFAMQCSIKGSWALPVFEGSSQTCVGVLEIVCLYYTPSVWHKKSFLGYLCDIFQEFGLRFFDGYKHCEMQCRYKNKAPAFQELDMVFQSVCKINKLPLALTWVSCSSCNDLLRSQSQFADVDSFYYPNLCDFMDVSRECYLKKGLVTGRILPSSDLLYCSDIKQFRIAEYPLAPYVRRCKLSGWFTMCLKSSCMGNEFYALEFFLPTSSKDNENILTTISLILGTMEENFKTFKLASGRELGEVLSVEVLDFQNDQKSHSVQMIKAARCIPSLEPVKVGGVAMQLDSSNLQSMDCLNNRQNVGTMEQNIISASSAEEGTRKTQAMEHKTTGARIDVSFEDILKCSRMSPNKAARKLKVSIPGFKRVCREYGIYGWPPPKINMVCYSRPLPVEDQEQIPKLPSDLHSDQASACDGNIKPGLQDASMVTIKAKYENYTFKFKLPFSSRLEDLKHEVAKRLKNLGAGTYYVKYKDEDDELILIACDEDLQDCIHTYRSMDKSTMVVLLEPKQPITNLNPTA